MSLTLLTPPAQEPVTLADMKAWLRIDGVEEDGLITALMMSARLSIETITSKALITQSWRMMLDQWPSISIIEVPLAPLQLLIAARIYTADGSTMALAVGDFRVEISAKQQPRLALLKRQPPPMMPIAGIELDCVAGYGDDGTSVPEPLKLALKMLVAFWFVNRGDEPTGVPLKWPDEISRLLAPYQMRRL